MNKSKKRGHRYINGTKGVISLFLACLLVPFTTLACALLTAARIESAVAIFDEALCNASNSTLGTYDSFLRKRFGLLAMEQNTSGKITASGTSYSIEQLINETFNEYLKENLKTLSNTYLSYDATATGVYSLADTDVLLAQVLEYSKYSVPTKILADGLDLDDLVKMLEDKLKSAFAITDFVTKLVGSFGSIITLCGDYQTFKDSVTNETTAKTEYSKAYTNFKAAADNYKDKYREMQDKIQEQQDIIDAESPGLSKKENAKKSAQSNYNSSTKKVNAYKALIERFEDIRDGKALSKSDSDFLKYLKNNYGYSMTQEEYDKYCEDIDTAITSFNELKRGEELNNGNLKSTYNNATNAYNAANSKITKAQNKIASIKNEYESTLSSLKSTADTKKAEYISAIGTLQSKLKDSKSALIKVQGDLTSATTSITDAVTQGVDTYVTVTQESIESDIKTNNKLIEKYKEEDNNDALEALTSENERLEKEKKELKENSNQDYAKALSGGMTSAMNSIKIGSKEIEVSEYDTIWGKLNDAKTTTQNVSEYKTTIPSGCYYSFTQIVDNDTAKSMWKEFLKEIFSSELWAMIDALKSIMQMLFSFQGAVDGALNALVDTGYFPGGLPSATNTKSEVNESDKNESERWKSLLGTYSSIGDDASGTGGLTNLFDTLGGQLDSISGIDKGSEDQEPEDTKNFFSACKDMISGFVNCIKTACNSIKDVFNQSNMYQKVLLNGYYIYMTSNRMTYASGNNLSGNSYNLRGQSSSTSSTGALETVANGFIALFGQVDVSLTSDARCFYGAETEYLFGQSMNEMQNQLKTFNLIYMVRMFLNLPGFFNASFMEIVSALAPTIIGSVLIVLLYVIVEPLLDTLILVNGGQIPVVKTKLFLTPDGFGDLMKCIGSCKTGKFSTQSVKDELAAEVSYISGTQVSVTDEKLKFNPLYIDYTEQLFLLTFAKGQDEILNSLADIIQMEASENRSNEMGNVKTFDLTKAYTYVRVEASFSTKEFIKLTDTGMFTSTDRVMYRGY